MKYIKMNHNNRYYYGIVCGENSDKRFRAGWNVKFLATVIDGLYSNVDDEGKIYHPIFVNVLEPVSEKEYLASSVLDS